MSVQSIRRSLGVVIALEKQIWEEKGKRLPVEVRWEQAKTVQYWFNEIPRQIGRCYMTQKKLEKTAEKSVEFKGFVNYVLSTEDKAAFSVWGIDDHDLFLLAAGCLQQGYKMGISYNSKNDTFTATLMCNDSNSPNAGYLLSAFAPDWYNAVKSLIFKHDVVLDGVWDVDKPRNENNWG